MQIIELLPKLLELVKTSGLRRDEQIAALKAAKVVLCTEHEAVRNHPPARNV